MSADLPPPPRWPSTEPTGIEAFNRNPWVVLSARLAAWAAPILVIALASFIWDIDRRVLVLERDSRSYDARLVEQLARIERRSERIEDRLLRIEARVGSRPDSL